MISDLGGKKVRNAEALGELQKSVSVGGRKEGRESCKELEGSVETTLWEQAGSSQEHSQCATAWSGTMLSAQVWRGKCAQTTGTSHEM